jgi:hypothetical protein
VPIGLTTAIIGSAAIAGTAAVAGGAMASHAQTKAAARASDTQLQMQDQVRGDLSPFRTAGADFTNQLTSRMGDLTSPFNMTEAGLEATPGYQFTKTQGLKAVNNALGARGLMNSGAVMKGAAGFATGLADSTYMDQFNIDQTQKTNAFNKLMAGSQLGESAAAQTGAFGTQAATQVGQNTIGAGNASAAGIMAGANGIASTAQSVPQAMMMNQLISKMGTGGPISIYGGR